jgi:hypothetical protein
MIWFIIMMVVNTDGSVNAGLHYPLQPQFNNEKSCNETGQTLADEEQLKVGLNNGKIFWKCEPILFDDIKSLTGQDI